jgi:hypothetical protein
MTYRFLKRTAYLVSIAVVLGAVYLIAIMLMQSQSQENLTVAHLFQPFVAGFFACMAWDLVRRVFRE